MMAAEHSIKRSALLSLRSCLPAQGNTMKPALGVMELTMLACGCCSVSKSCLTFATQWTAAHQASLSSTVSRTLLKFVSIESVILSNCLILCHPLLFLPSIFPSIRVFSNELALCIRWPKYWSFSFSISPSKECSGLTSFRTDWFDLLAIQGTLKSLQDCCLKASILWHLAFFMFQLSHPYMTTGETIALTIWTFVGQVMSLPFEYTV